MSGSNLVVVLSGSIACFKACAAISSLVQRGHRVRTIATQGALQFVGPATLEGLTGSPPLHDLFAPGAAMAHLNLGKWAHLVLICPATANTLNRVAAGLADDLAGAFLLGLDRAKPCLVAPAMNPSMWAHPATVASVSRLRSWGFRFIPVGEGRLACGDEGEGRLAEPADVVSAVEAALRRPEKTMRVLVTSGGTAEPIDGVRVISNRSTGATGALIAQHLCRAGHAVVHLRARNARRSGEAVREETFETFADLDAALTRELGRGEVDAIVHAAAVGDFSVDSLEIDGRPVSALGGKLDSSRPPVIRLRANPKLVDDLRRRSPRPLRLVAFKLTRDADAAQAREASVGLAQTSAADWVVHNDLAEQPANGVDFPATIFDGAGVAVSRCANRADLAAALEQLLVNAPPGKWAEPADGTQCRRI